MARLLVASTFATLGLLRSRTFRRRDFHETKDGSVGSFRHSPTNSPKRFRRLSRPCRIRNNLHELQRPRRWALCQPQTMQSTGQSLRWGSAIHSPKHSPTPR
jgi:hypothetical protein